jgi:5-methylcytosine-specific restriction protein A
MPRATKAPGHAVKQPWANSDRRKRLPKDWAHRRRWVMERAGFICEWQVDGRLECDKLATEVDHVERGDNHALWNLQALCHDHHFQKTLAERG